MTACFLRVPGRIPGAAFLLAVGAAGCGGFGGSPPPPVITVGERGFTHEEFDRFVDARTALVSSFDAAVLSALLDEFARERLLLLAADEAGIEIPETQLLAEIGALNRGPRPDAVRSESRDSPEPLGSFGEAGGDTDRLRAEVENRLRVNRLLETVVLGDLEAPQAVALFEFETNRAFYARPDMVTLSEARFPDRESAEAGVRRLADAGSENGADDEPDRFRRVGSFRRGELPEAMERAVFGLEPGRTTGVLETAAGFRIFRIEERLPAATLDFEEVEDVVRQSVLRKEADARLEVFLAGLRDRFPVTVHADRLRFPYVGLLRE